MMHTHTTVNAAPAAVALAPALRPSHDTHRRFALSVAQLAVSSLHAELCLYPKPGLVSPMDAGSHTDMDATTFMRSLFALRHYFKQICRAGLRDAPFVQLKQLGIDAEAAMLKATQGVNTHRGAIFSLGMLCAAAGQLHARRLPISPTALRSAMLTHWGTALAQHACPAATDSHGLNVARRYAASGAREEGAQGLPSVFEVGVPALLAACRRGASMEMARTDALFALMAHISDSNVFHRAGPQGAQFVRDHARHFLGQGGTADPNWRTTALASHREFVARRLSPGGAADLLAATCLVHALTVQPDQAP
jgi:triphosphoribosyl-dephospho-CoA synthase